MGEKYISILWNYDDSSIEECSEKIIKTIVFLEGLNLDLSQWYRAKRPVKKSELKPISFSTDKVLGILSERVLSDPGESFLGYQLSLKSSENFVDSSFLNIHCGARSQTTGNRLVLSFSDNIASEIDSSNILKELSSIWTPDVGIYSTESFRSSLEKISSKKILIGLRTYLGDRSKFQLNYKGVNSTENNEAILLNTEEFNEIDLMDLNDQIIGVIV
ncbi:MAG: hypothetical protein JXR03_21665 [Cyclobacteriaceae bacterium]